jgi:hypothetical protein
MLDIDTTCLTLMCKKKKYNFLIKKKNLLILDTSLNILILFICFEKKNNICLKINKIYLKILINYFF